MEVFKKSFRIEQSEVGPEGYILLDSLQRRIQNISDEHGYLLGFGFDDMKKRGFFWVVSRLMVEIKQMPRLNDMLTIETFLTPPTGAGINRYYQLFNSEGLCLITGVAKWSVVSNETLKLVKTNQLDFVTNLQFSKEAIEFSNEGLKRIDFPSDQEVILKSLVVKQEDLDFNNHVNNTIYVKYIRDLFGIPSDLYAYQINFISPLYLGDKVHIKAVSIENKIVFEATRELEDMNEEISFQAWFLKIS
ncbi:MAG: acyl-[acyl-carrier-protein] thioesterase [Candidatus Izemoplasmatales bacterium]